LFTTQKFRDKFTPHLTAIIVLESNNKLQLCGYIMNKGQTLTMSEMLKYVGDMKVRKMWLKGMKKYKFLYNDFKLDNVIKTGNKVGMIDIEAFRPLHRLKKLGKNSIIKMKLFNLEWYFKYLQNVKIEKS
jgi:hypothetical protein